MGQNELQQFISSWFDRSIREIAVGLTPSAPTFAPRARKNRRRHFYHLSALEESQRFARHVQPPMSEFVVPILQLSTAACHFLLLDEENTNY
jgi:hypothetical protein